MAPVARAARARTRTLAGLVLLIATARAHPTLLTFGCGEKWHPDKAHGPHKAPVRETAITISLFWANGVNDRPMPKDERPSLASWRAANEYVALPPGSFAPGERYAVLLECGKDRACEAMLTTGGGEFVDDGPGTDGMHSMKAVVCQGMRYNLKGAKPYHVIEWTAPTADRTRFDVTAATGEHESFMRMPPLFLTANHTLLRPAGVVAGSSLPGAAPLSIALFVHASLACFAFFALLPASVGMARYLRVPPSPGESAELALAGKQADETGAGLSLRARLARDRIIMHRLGASVAAALLCGSYAAVLVSKATEGGAHLASAHARWGVAALVLAAYQLQGGLLRPPAASPPSIERRRWRFVHALSGTGTLMAGWVAAALALVRVVQNTGVRGFDGALVVGTSALAATVICCGLGAEVVTRRAARTRPSGGSHSSRKSPWVELDSGETAGAS